MESACNNEMQAYLLLYPLKTAIDINRLHFDFVRNTEDVTDAVLWGW